MAEVDCSMFWPMSRTLPNPCDLLLEYSYKALHGNEATCRKETRSCRHEKMLKETTGQGTEGTEQQEDRSDLKRTEQIYTQGRTKRGNKRDKTRPSAYVVPGPPCRLQAKRQTDSSGQAAR